MKNLVSILGKLFAILYWFDQSVENNQKIYEHFSTDIIDFLNFNKSYSNLLKFPFQNLLVN